jgi:hypothetical protein
LSGLWQHRHRRSVGVLDRPRPNPGLLTYPWVAARACGGGGRPTHLPSAHPRNRSRIYRLRTSRSKAKEECQRPDHRPDPWSTTGPEVRPVLTRRIHTIVATHGSMRLTRGVHRDAGKGLPAESLCAQLTSSRVATSRSRPRVSPWTRAAYDAARARCQSHRRAVRSVGARWVSIVWRCWKSPTCQPDVRHAR